MPDAFAPGPSQPTTAPLLADAALLDAEKLDAYRVALEFQAVAVQLATACPRRARSLLVRVAQMLTRLVARMAADLGLRGGGGDVAVAR